METLTRPNITMMPVVSSQISNIGHDAESRTLAIQFTGKEGHGSLYHYQNFGADDFAALRDAESVGKHFYKHIKPFSDKHPYEKIEASDAETERVRLQGLAEKHLVDAGVGSGQRYSTTTFKDNGEPILLNADGSRSIFCDLCDDMDVDDLFPTDAELVSEIRRMCAESFGMDGAATDARMAQFDYAAAVSVMDEAA